MRALFYGIYILFSSSILGRDKTDLSIGTERIPLMAIDHPAVALKKSLKAALKVSAVGVDVAVDSMITTGRTDR